MTTKSTRAEPIEYTPGLPFAAGQAFHVMTGGYVSLADRTRRVMYLRILAVVEGYVMARYNGAVPFIRSEQEFRKFMDEDYLQQQRQRYNKGGYVVIPELPKEQQEPFRKWLVGQTLPMIEAEGENAFHCAWFTDYDRWVTAWLKGQVAINFD